MALQKKESIDYGKLIKHLEKQIETLSNIVEVMNERIIILEQPKIVGYRQATINKFEIQEEPVELKEESKMKMGYEDQLASMRNAARLLPPNLKVDGRHTLENISALCGFIATEEMLDEVYKDIVDES